MIEPGIEPTDAVAVAAEALSWLLVPLGLLLLVAATLRRSWAARYRRTQSVVVATDDASMTLRWFGEYDRAQAHEMSAPLDELAKTAGDARTVWVHPSGPDKARLDSPAHDGRALLALGALFASVGVIATVVSFVLPLLN
jgi:hypothetical protein